jgi:hypothetical protein
MPNRTIARAILNRLSSLPLNWTKSTLSSLPWRLFDGLDATARQHGWQVSSTHHGYGRRYRDPRFDTLAPREERRDRGAVPEPPSSRPRGLA